MLIKNRKKVIEKSGVLTFSEPGDERSITAQELEVKGQIAVESRGLLDRLEE